MSRRLVLNGLGGAALAVPYLRSVEEKAARAQGSPVPSSPRRLIVMFTHFGCLTTSWFPAKSHGPLGAADLEKTTLSPLVPYVEKLLLPRGIRAMNEWTFDMALGQGNDPHLQVVGSYFTCAPVSPHSDDPFAFESELKFNAKPMSASLDHVCARQLSSNGLPLFLRVGAVNDSPQSAISYSGPGEAFPGVGLADAMAGLSGIILGEDMSEDSYRVARGQGVLDIVRDDLATLERFDMSQTDRHKLEAWKQLLQDTSGPIFRCSMDDAGGLGLTAENLDKSSTLGADRLTAKVTDSLDLSDLYSNIAVLSALCNANPVIWLKYPANYVFSGLGISLENDSLSHRVGNSGMGGTCVSGINNMIQTLDRYYAEKFAHLVGQLNEFDEGDGTLLDNTAAVWFQQSSDGCAFNLNNMPILQAGGCGGYFKTGQAVNVWDGSADLHRGNSDLCEDGLTFTDVKAFGTPQEIANAPINKYYCNLMNAVGVKAGEDGYPLVGGTGEVTHYGYYDDTKDFISGGALPPTIHDPGGFEDLKA